MHHLILHGIGATVELVERLLLVHPTNPGADGEPTCADPAQCSGLPCRRIPVEQIDHVSLVPADRRRCGYLAFRLKRAAPRRAYVPETRPFLVVLFAHDGNVAAQSIHRAFFVAPAGLSVASGMPRQFGESLPLS